MPSVTKVIGKAVDAVDDAAASVNKKAKGNVGTNGRAKGTGSTRTNAPVKRRELPRNPKITGDGQEVTVKPKNGEQTTKPKSKPKNVSRGNTSSKPKSKPKPKNGGPATTTSNSQTAGVVPGTEVQTPQNPFRAPEPEPPVIVRPIEEVAPELAPRPVEPVSVESISSPSTPTNPYRVGNVVKINGVPVRFRYENVDIGETGTTLLPVGIEYGPMSRAGRGTPLAEDDTMWADFYTDSKRVLLPDYPKKYYNGELNLEDPKDRRAIAEYLETNGIGNHIFSGDELVSILRGDNPKAILAHRRASGANTETSKKGK
jgi:hypothetical protein